MESNAVIQIGTALIALLGAIVTYIIVPYFKARTTAEQQANIVFWITVAVNAAEQIYKEKGQGKLKKEYVLEFLGSIGLKVTGEEADILIEAIVREVNQGI